MWVRARTHAPLPPDNQIPGALLPEVMDTKPPKLLQEFDRACSHNLTQQPSPLLSSPLRSPLWAHEEQRGSCRWLYKLPTRHNFLGGTVITHAAWGPASLEDYFTAKNLINTYFFFRLFLVHVEGVGQCFLTRRWQRRSILTTPSLWYKLCHQQWPPWFQ